MRAILIKELRENLKWALLMLIALAAALAYAVHSDAPRGLSLVGEIMVMVSAIAFPVIGFTLGLLQILQDRGVGRWGFLTHRPLSRTRIFMAKVVAGLLLYGIASAIPLAGVILWIATPGHLAAPFDGHMILPRLSDLVCGIVWYSTGLVIASRQARWIGSRLMPIGLALLVSIFAWVFPLLFWQAALIIIAGLAIILPAAATSFDASGIFERQPALARFLHVLSVGTGMALLVGAAVATLIATIEWGRPTARAEYQTYRISPDGQIIHDTYDANGIAQSTDLQGHPAPGTGNTIEQPTASSVSVPLKGFESEKSDWSDLRTHQGLQNSESYLFPLGPGGSDTWFYVTRRRTIEGFDAATNRFIGSIGPDGFVPASQPPVPFPEPLHPNEGDRFSETWGMFEASRTTAYQIDLRRRELHVVFKAPADDPLLSAPKVLTTPWDPQPLTIIATRSRIRVQKAARELFQLPLERVDPQHEWVSIAAVSSDRFIFHYVDWWQPALNPDSVVETDGTGHIQRRFALPPLRNPARVEPRWAEALQAAALPPVFGAVGVLAESPIAGWMLAIVCCVGIVSAAMVIAVCRRHAFSRTATTLWAAFGLVTGIPGVLTLLALRQLPARIRCPNCARLRVVTRENCEHCGAPFGAPPSEQIEVFEAA